MARMRSLKPEFWHDQEITRLPRDARLLYMAMWNLADEHSRLQGDPRFLKGQAFPYDDDLPAAAVLELVDELIAAGKVERYTVRDAIYLLLPKLAKHQRLDTAKVPSRLPSPDEAESRAESCEKIPDQGVDKNALSMLQVAGGREHVAGSMEHDSTTSGAPRTALAVIESPTAQTIVAEWLERCAKRPPSPVIGQTAKIVGQMLAEGIDPDDVRRGVAAWMDKGLHPSTLPSVVNEVMNGGSRASPGRASSKAHDWLTIDQKGTA